MNKDPVIRITLELDRLDYDAIQKAFAKRQQYPVPEGDSNTAGALVAEICRGWMEMLKIDSEPDDGVIE